MRSLPFKGTEKSLVPLAFLIPILAALPYFSSCARKPEVISLGTLGGIKDTLVFVAADEGFFRENSLDIVIKIYANGVAAIGGMLSGEVDMAYASEYVTVQQAFKKADLRIFVVEARSMGSFIVGRKDRGIQNVADLTGKRIGLPKGASPEFLLGRFLQVEGVEGVTIIDVQPAKLSSALASGAVDAVVATPRWVYDIRREHGDSFVYWPAEGNQPGFDTLAATSGWLTNHASTVKRFLRALAKAQVYTEEHPDKARAIVNKRLKWSESFMADQWRNIYFSLSLDSSLIVAMESEARWMIFAGLTAEKEVPNFFDYVYPDGLRAVKPESVSFGH